MKKTLNLIYNNFFDLQLIFVIISAFSCIEFVCLIDESQDISSIDNTDSNKSNTEDGTVKSTNSMTEFEHKMQKFMSMHMDNVLSDLRKDIQNSESSTNNTDSKETMSKEDLEKVYYNEVDFKLRVDSLTNKLEKELAVKENSSLNEGSSSNNENIPENKRIADEITDSNNKKTKK